MKDRKNRRIVAYPWKSFLIFLGLYILSVISHYPVLLSQAEIYIGILGDTFNSTPVEFAITAMVQPILLGVIAIYFGHRYAHKVNLRSLLSEKVEENYLTAETKTYSLKDSIPFLVTIAAVIAVVELGFDAVFQNWLPDIYQPNFAVPNLGQTLSRIFYTGLGQELLLRWGVMTSVVYVLSAKGRNINHWHYIIGFVFTALLYAFAQYGPTMGYIDFNFIILLRILLLSGLPGILYGWLYSTFHFEAAAISHMLANALIVLGNILIV